MKAVKGFLFFLIIPVPILFLIPIGLARLGGDRKESGITGRAAAAVAWLGGGAICVWCITRFATQGRGTPAPNAPTEALVETGLYGRSRNPLYLGALLFLLGYLFWFQTVALLGYVTAVGLLFQSVVVLYEEPRLRRQFGEAYEQYCERVPRWFSCK